MAEEQMTDARLIECVAAYLDSAGGNLFSLEPEYRTRLAALLQRDDVKALLASPREASPRGYDCPDHGPSLTGCGCPSCVESSLREAGREVSVVSEEDVEEVEAFLSTHCDGSPNCTAPHRALERILASLRPALPEKGGSDNA